jgi:ArsR family transcriptional regulator
MPILSCTKEPASLDECTAVQVAELFRAFSDTCRVRVISALAEWELNVSTLAAAVGFCESAESYKMRGLSRPRHVRARKDGHQFFYCQGNNHIAAMFKQGLDHLRHG